MQNGDESESVRRLRTGLNRYAEIVESIFQDTANPARNTVLEDAALLIGTVAGESTLREVPEAELESVRLDEVPDTITDLAGRSFALFEAQGFCVEETGVESELTFNRNGIMFIGDKGRVFVNRGNVYGKPAEELAQNPLPEDAWKVRHSDNHMGNFFACVKTRQQPVSPVQIQHRTVTACHLTNISLRLGRKLTWDPEAQAVIGDQEANTWQKREQRAPYLVEA